MLLFFSIVSCQNDDRISKELKLDGETFKEFSSAVKFERDYTLDIPNSKKSIGKMILDEVNRLEDQFEEDENLEDVSYQISHQGAKIRFYDFHFTKKNELGKPGPTSDDDWYGSGKCPNGQDLVNTCYSKACVEETISGLAGNFSSGETITIYHTGLSVRVCSNVK